MNHPLADVRDPDNEWRRETPGASGWERSCRPGAADRYLMLSADTHINEPSSLWSERIDAKFHDRLPKLHVDDSGKSPSPSPDGEGFRAAKLLVDGLGPEETYRLTTAAKEIDGRVLDEDWDGIDAEMIFPTKGLLVFSTRDSEFAMAQARIYNDWVIDACREERERFLPMALVPTIEVADAVAEVERAAKLGFRGVLLPVKPLFGPEKFDDPNYNLPMYDPLWAAISDAGIAATFHVATGRDPRVARKNGGAIINLTWGARATAISTLTFICASGVLDRNPRLRFAIIEAGVGWVPWTLESMDEAYRKHHMWVQPKLKRGLPSEYFREHGFASFEEDAVGIALVESMRLERCFLWANDYPHAEGTWPHSAAAIERQMGSLREDTRRQLLGENACRLLGLDPAAVIARRRAVP